MASSSIESVAKFIGNLLVEEVQYLAAVQEKVEDLQSELEWMQCFLLDIDTNRCKDALLRKWVLKIRDVAYEAEDLIETYIHKVSHKRQNTGCLLYDPKWLLCCWRDAKTLHNVGSNIDALTAKITKMSSRLERYGVKSTSYGNHLSNVKSMIVEQRRTYGHERDNNIVGLEESVAQLVEGLQGGFGQQIVVLHGMGGIGKTTLAREVFSHTALKNEFGGFAWAYISQQLQFEPVCKDILLQLTPENEKASVRKLQDSQLPGKLYDKLKQKKCLLVLDDVWFKNDWKRLEHAFPTSDTSHGSKFLITTRDPHILSGTGLANDLIIDYPLNILDKDRSWELLQKTANFQRQGADKRMVELGDKMLGHCNGHPLAIAVLGGVLATKSSVQEWESVSDSLPYHLQGDDEGSYTGVYEVLAMSYYELPYHIKPCFLHLGYFPEDFDIPLEKLYDLWIAEGIVSSTFDEVATKRSGRSLEDICEVYLNELLQKNMVQVGSRDEYGKIESCRLHDLMRDKCLEINKEENYLQFIDYQACKSGQQEAAKFNTPISEKLRRMGIHVDNEIPNNPIPMSASGKSPPLRSILFTAPKNSKNQDCGFIVGLCKGFELLRVLDFSYHIVLKGSTLPTEVGSLIFLRYLSLKDCFVGKLPSSIQNMRSLMILDLRQDSHILTSIPNVIWKMKSLRHLYLPFAYEIKKGNMLKLEQLSQLEKLEDVDLDRVDAVGLVRLAESIRTLSANCKSNKENLVPFLKSKSIKSLSLTIHANIVKDDPTILSTCDSLKSLTCFEDTRQQVLWPMTLEMFPPNLVKLELRESKSSEDPMPILGLLSKLKILTLDECYDGSELACTEKGFQELTHLRICFMHSLRNWTVKKGGLPKLQKVDITDCPKMILPDVLPSQVSITCQPCVTGIEQYGTCRHFIDNRKKEAKGSSSSRQS